MWGGRAAIKVTVPRERSKKVYNTKEQGPESTRRQEVPRDLARGDEN